MSFHVHSVVKQNGEISNQIIRSTALKKTATGHNGLFKKVIIAKNEIPGLFQFASSEFKVNDIVEIHSHDSMTEVFYLVSGSLKLLTDDEEYLINNGDTVYNTTKAKP